MCKIGRKLTRPKQRELSIQEKPVSSPVFADNFPTLWEFLEKRRDFGEYHQTGCVTIFVDGDKIKLCANDRPNRQSSFVSGDNLLQALARLDRGLLEGSLRWSKQGYKRRSAAKVNR